MLFFGMRMFFWFVISRPVFIIYLAFFNLPRPTTATATATTATATTTTATA